MKIVRQKSPNGKKIYLYYDYGRAKGDRVKTGMFLYAKPANAVERQHNKQTTDLLLVKQGQQVLEQQAIGTGYIPEHRFKANFLDYYSDFVENNKRDNNRHLSCCFSKFKTWIKRPRVAPIEITYDLCFRFRRHLLDTLKGETPQNYFATFKRMLESATREGYFKICPTDNIPAIKNPSEKLPDFLEVDEFLQFIAAPPPPQIRETIEAFIFALYTGVRWCDVENLQWGEINGFKYTTRMLQAKTKQPVILHLHHVAMALLRKRRQHLGETILPTKKVFNLPSHKAAIDVIKDWAKKRGINKNVTPKTARLTYSILLQDKSVDTATVAYLLGHTTTKQVSEIYKRHRPKNQMESVNNLPIPDVLPDYLKFTE